MTEISHRQHVECEFRVKDGKVITDYALRKTTETFVESGAKAKIVKSSTDPHFAVMCTGKGAYLLRVCLPEEEEVVGEGQLASGHPQNHVNVTRLRTDVSSDNWFISKGLCGCASESEVLFYSVQQPSSAYRLYLKENKLCFCDDDFFCVSPFGKIFSIEPQSITVDTDPRTAETLTSALLYLKTDTGSYRIHARCSHVPYDTYETSPRRCICAGVGIELVKRDVRGEEVSVGGGFLTWLGGLWKSKTK